MDFLGGNEDRNGNVETDAGETVPVARQVLHAADAALNEQAVRGASIARALDATDAVDIALTEYQVSGDEEDVGAGALSAIDTANAALRTQLCDDGLGKIVESKLDAMRSADFFLNQHKNEVSERRKLPGPHDAGFVSERDEQLHKMSGKRIEQLLVETRGAIEAVDAALQNFQQSTSPPPLVRCLPYVESAMIHVARQGLT